MNETLFPRTGQSTASFANFLTVLFPSMSSIFFLSSLLTLSALSSLTTSTSYL